MSHRVEERLTYPGTTVEAVVAMLMTPAFREAACASQKRIVGHSVTIEGPRVTIDQRHSADGVPGVAKKFVGDEIRILQEESWTSPTHGDITVSIPGKPGSVTGTADLAQVGDDVVETVVLDITVNIPLVGNKIAGMIGDKLARTLRAENEVGLAWLNGDN